MLTQWLIVALATVVDVSSAASLSTAETPSATSFSVPRVLNSNFTKDVIQAKAKVFRKYNWMLPSNTVPFEEDFAHKAGVVLSSTRKPTFTQAHRSTSPTATNTVQSGNVHSTPQPYHAEYLSPVQIGGQLMHLDFDTGSSDFWVFSTLQPNSQTVNHDAVYDPSKSPTYQYRTGLSWNVQYGDLSYAKGVVGSDTVKLGAFGTGLTLASGIQSVELATDVSKGFITDVANDGLVGMAFSNINTVQPTPQKTFFDNIKTYLALKLFAVNLLEDGSGSFDFGYINQSAHTGYPLVNVPVDPSKGLWQVACPEFGVGGARTLRSSILAGGIVSPAIVDSGTSLLIVDPIVAYYYWSTVPGSGYSAYFGGYIYPCTTTLPSFGAKLGVVNAGIMVTVPGHLLAYAQLDTKMCFGGVQSNNGYDLQIFGDVLFRSAYIVFYGDLGNPSLGVAQKAA